MISVFEFVAAERDVLFQGKLYGVQAITAIRRN